MRRDTAIRRLRTIAERCQQVSGLWDDDDPVLVAAYTFGAVLDGAAELPAVQVAFVLDLPADELTWCVQPQDCTGLVGLLELEKAPVDWYWRPAVWPVANHVIRRPLGVWSAAAGVDEAALDALARGEAERLRQPAPADDDLQDQLSTELQASLAHLRRVESAYWEREWRSAHRGLGVDPEHHLWNAAHGYLELLAAADPRRRPTGTR